LLGQPVRSVTCGGVGGGKARAALDRRSVIWSMLQGHKFIILGDEYDCHIYIYIHIYVYIYIYDDVILHLGVFYVEAAPSPLV
jgi:hypothetical protein